MAGTPNSASAYRPAARQHAPEQQFSRGGRCGRASWPGFVHAHGDDQAGGGGGGGEQGRVDHGGGGAEQHSGRRPHREGGTEGGQADRGGLHGQAGRDQPFAADPVRQCAGGELPGAPDGRVKGSQDADLADGQPVAGEQEREDAPGDAVAEVVDHARLAGGRQGRFGEAGEPRDLAGGQVPAQVTGRRNVPGGLVAGVAAGFPDEGG